MELTYKQTGSHMNKIEIAGRLAHMAGQLPNPGWRMEVQEEARLVLPKITNLLYEAGSGKDRIIPASFCLAEIADFEAFNEVRDAWVVPGRTPARICLESRLVWPEWKIEVAAVVALGDA